MEKDVTQQQGRITDNLARIIQIAQIEGRTGELRVGRGEGINAEAGVIGFSNGQIVFAQVGSYTGGAALNVLKTWGKCVFVFVPRLTTAPLQQTGPISNQRDTGPIPNQRDTGPIPNQREISPAISSLGKAISPQGESTNEMLTDIPFSLTAIPKATMSVVKAISVIEKAGLPRIYRQVILSIDGRHTVGELIGSANCTPEEMGRILQTLEELSIIRVTG